MKSKFFILALFILVVHINNLFFVKRFVFVLIVIFMYNLEACITAAIDNRTASLSANQVDIIVSKVIYRIAVRENDALILYYNIIKVVVTEEHCIGASAFSR